MRFLSLLLALFAIANARHINKRSNAYGDEQVTPAPATEAPTEAPAPLEEAPKPADQPAPCGEAPKIEASGYRAKRSNAYGDEQVTPAPAATEAPAPLEEAPKDAEQPQTPCGEAPKTEASGYRAKRSNAYGDEQVTPAAVTEAPTEAPAPIEEAPKPADQPAPCGEAPKIEASGYRAKRSNAYGDEQVTPAPAATEAPAPLEEAPKDAEQPQTPCGEAPKTEASGYRAKRSNAYGDEQVTPAPATEAPTEAPAPLEEAPKPADQPAPCGEAPKIEASGYRAKRSNAYGDEQVTPAPAATEAPAPLEEAPKDAEQPQTPCGEAPKTEASGYRAKRSNAYGDEQVTPAPATEAPTEAPAPLEEAPKPADQPAPCGEAPKIEASGYRAKRSNAYGDEQVTPAPAATEAPAPLEEAPKDAEQPQTPCGEAPKTEASGYRAKRSNAYGDEQVTPAAVTEAPTEAPAPIEEAPKPADQPAPCGEAPKIEASGYRAKRSNAYGDEQVTPAPAATEAPAPLEEAPKDAEQAPTPCGEAPKSEASGYRV